jgi:hypothetical protein
LPSFEDRVEEELRRRMTAVASAAGVDRGRIELEVLFLLPPEFVRLYQALFRRALADPVAPIGDGGKDEGRIKASGKPNDPMKARSMGGASGGKRFVRGAWPIRDEAALQAKTLLDRRILAAIRQTWDTLVPPSLGAAPAESQTVPRRCAECNLFQRSEWKRCPFHPETEIG